MPRADEFRHGRWVRGGATKKELTALRRAHRALSYDEQVAEAARIDGISDLDLAAELEAARTEPPVTPPGGASDPDGPASDDDPGSGDPEP